MLPSMEMDALDEIMQITEGRAGQSLSSTVGNSYILKLAKLGITEVIYAVISCWCLPEHISFAAHVMHMWHWGTAGQGCCLPAPLQRACAAGPA
jgi:hypothetical protein